MILLTLLVGPLQLFFVCLGLLLCLTLEFYCTVVLTKVQYWVGSLAGLAITTTTVTTPLREF